MNPLTGAFARAIPSGIATHPRVTATLLAQDGVLLEAEGVDFSTGEQVEVEGPQPLRGEVVGFRNNRTLVAPLGPVAGLSPGLRVRRLPASANVAVGEALLGRVIGPCGEALDGRGPIATDRHWPLRGQPRNPLACPSVTTPFDVGVRVLNACTTFGQGQRVALVAGSGVGKSVLLRQMLRGADCDVAVAALIGERAREVSDFVADLDRDGSRARTVVVAVPADHAPLLRIRAALQACAIAESFRSEGKRVLLLVDSLTRIAHAQREIGLALGEPPTLRGYPPSALALIPRLLERAGGDTDSGGSITGIYTVLADGGDLDDPVVDSARAISDGHIILSRTLAEQGLFPAVDLARSLSRVMHDVVDDAHYAAALAAKRLWASYADNKDLLAMGAYAPGNDAQLDRAIERQPVLETLVRQGMGERVDLSAARAALLEAVA